MNWGKIGFNLLVMGGVYCIGYFSSYFFSKRWAIKKIKEKKEEKK